MVIIFADMALLNFIIWNGSPEIFSINTFALRWYGLFFALGFLVTQQILYYIYRKEGKPEKDVETITIYMVLATVLGARLGHVIFYQPEIIWEDPLGIFLPFEFSPFKFTGLQGLASHGGAIGILFALWLYSNYRISFSKVDVDLDTKSGNVNKKVKRGFFATKVNIPGQSYLQVLDRIVILVALVGAFIRLGNYFNSEIIGLPTDGPTGVIFVNRLTESLEDKEVNGKPIVADIVYHRNDSLPLGQNGRVPLSIYIFFENGVDEDQARSFVEYGVKDLLANRLYEYFDEGMEPIDYAIVKEQSGTFVARVHTFGISRHPAQLYESFSCLLLFLWLFWLWSRYKETLPEGRLFGIFLIVCFGLRFFYEFLKENQESFEDDLILNMGQILSIPLVIAGILVLIYSFRNKKATSPT
jgi:phosphatidylglycerol:prolipoprotein diacylglycerol transferase